MVAVLNLLDRMTAILEIELVAADAAADAAAESDPADGGAASAEEKGPLSAVKASRDDSEPSSLTNTPCLDTLLSENILAHVLAASRMPVSVPSD